MRGAELPSSRRDRRVWAVALVVAAAVVVWLSVLASQHWFFADDWTFVNRAGTDDLNLWVVPYSGHWMAATVGWFTWMQQVVRLGSYVPYVLPAILSHAAIGLLLWRWQVRDGVQPWLALGMVVPFLVLGVSNENVFFAVNLGFNLSLALALGFALLVDVDPATRPKGRLVVASTLAVASVPTTTTGILVVVVVAVALLVRRDLRGALAALPAVVLYGCWVLLAGGGSGLVGGPVAGLVAYTARLGLSGTVRIFGIAAPWLAAVVVAGLLIGALLRRTGPTPRATTWALAIVAGGFSLATALARLVFGASTWQSPRYLYIVAACTLPLVGALVERVVRDRRVLQAGIVVALLVGVVVNVQGVLEAHRRESGLEEHLRTRHLAAGQLLEAGLEPIPINVDRFWSPNLHWTHLEGHVAAGRIVLPADPVPDPFRLEAEIELRSVLHGPLPFDDLTTPRFVGRDDVVDGCLTLGPGEATDVRIEGPAGLEFRFDEPTIARLRTRTDDGRTTALERLLDLRVPGPRSWWIGLDQPVTMELVVDRGATVCVLDEASARRYAETEPG